MENADGLTRKKKAMDWIKKIIGNKKILIGIIASAVVLVGVVLGVIHNNYDYPTSTHTY